MRRQAAAGAVPPGGMPPGAAMPTGAEGFAGVNGGQPGAPGSGGQSPFGNEVAASSPEYPIQQFLQKLNAGDLGDATDLFSKKATGKARALREGKASEDMISELKSDVAGARALPAITLAGKHLVVLEQGDGNSGGGGYAGPQPVGGRSPRGQVQKGKPTRKVQFIVVSENDQMVIQDIKVTTSAVKVRAPNTRR
jgi:hypothetical protein